MAARPWFKKILLLLWAVTLGGSTGLAGSLSFDQLQHLLSKPLAFGLLTMVVGESSPKEGGRVDLIQAQLVAQGVKLELDGAYALLKDDAVTLVFPSGFQPQQGRGVQFKNLTLRFEAADLAPGQVRRFSFAAELIQTGDWRIKGAAGRSFESTGPLEGELKAQEVVWLKEVGLSVPLQMEFHDFALTLKAQDQVSQGQLDFTFLLVSPELKLKSLRSQSRFRFSQESFLALKNADNPKSQKTAWRAWINEVSASLNSKSRLEGFSFQDPASGETLELAQGELEIEQGLDQGLFGSGRYETTLKLSLDRFVASMLQGELKIKHFLAQSSGSYGSQASQRYQQSEVDQEAGLAQILALLGDSKTLWELNVEGLELNGGKDPMRIALLSVKGNTQGQGGKLDLELNLQAQGKRPESSGVLSQIDHKTSLKLKGIALEELVQTLQALGPGHDSEQSFAILWQLLTPSRLELDSSTTLGGQAGVSLKLARLQPQAAQSLELGYLDFVSKVYPAHGTEFFLTQLGRTGHLMGGLTVMHWQKLAQEWDSEEQGPWTQTINEQKGNFFDLDGFRLTNDFSVLEGEMKVNGKSLAHLGESPLYEVEVEEKTLRPLYAKWLNHDPKLPFGLGRMVAEGRQVPQNDELALAWFAQASEAGDLNGRAYYAGMLLEGRGTAQDLDRGNQLLLQPLQAGNLYGIYFAGRAAQFGYGRAADPAQAKVLLDKAARAGLDLAMLDLGLILLDSKQSQAEVEAGMRWVEFSARTYPEAAYVAFELFKLSNPESALAYLKQAAAMGHQKAKEALVILESQ